MPLGAIRRQHLKGQDLGLAGERVVARLLKRAGWQCLGARLATQDAELDLAMLDGETLVVVEVKTGRSRATREHFETAEVAQHWRPGHRFKQSDLDRVQRAAARMGERLRRTWRIDLVELIVFENETHAFHHIDIQAPLRSPVSDRLW